MSNRSFISRAAEERRQRLVVGRVVAQNFAACLVGRFERIEHRVDSPIRIGDLALPLHRIEIIHIGQIGLFIVAEQTHRISYSTTFGTRKKWSWVAGAFLTTSSAISPSMTTSGRFFISIGITEVIGSTPSTSTSDNCSTKASIALSSPCKWGTSASSTAIRARCAIRRAGAASADIDIGPANGKWSPPYSRPVFCAAPAGVFLISLRDG